MEKTKKSPKGKKTVSLKDLPAKRLAREQEAQVKGGGAPCCAVSYQPSALSLESRMLITREHPLATSSSQRSASEADRDSPCSPCSKLNADG